jgi:glycosyltransferase involved in cell wall biosynthesis
MSEKANEKLVSIIIVTYNSAKFVLETLESAKAQTYQNLELIVSDDCSTDNTLYICQKWISENKNRFRRAELINSEFNTGISSNCNRGMTIAEGEWVKLIAGDDILLDNCIMDNINFIQLNPNSELVFSKPKRFGGDIVSMKISENNYLANEWIFNASQEVQLQKDLERTPYWYACTLFLKKSIWKKFRFDENYPNVEDIPFMLKCLKGGHKLSYFPVFTVNYRFGHGDSVQHKISNKKAYFKLYHDEFFKYDIKHKGILFAWNHYLNNFVNTRKHKKRKFLLLLSPYFVFNFITKKIITKK